MLRTLFPRILLVMAVVAITVTFLSVDLYIAPSPAPGDFSVSSVLNSAQTTDLFGWSEAHAKKYDRYCKDHCNREYKERLRECKDRSHEHHHHCKKWAKERQRECLKNCAREHRHEHHKD